MPAKLVFFYHIYKHYGHFAWQGSKNVLANLYRSQRKGTKQPVGYLVPFSPIYQMGRKGTLFFEYMQIKMHDSLFLLRFLCVSLYFQCIDLYFCR